MSLSLTTLALVLRNILQNCGWQIHHKKWILISTRDHHRSPYSFIKTSSGPFEATSRNLVQRWCQKPPHSHCMHCTHFLCASPPHPSPALPLWFVNGDGLEYNLKTCIPERLANPWNGRWSKAPRCLGLNTKTSGKNMWSDHTTLNFNHTEKWWYHTINGVNIICFNNFFLSHHWRLDHTNGNLICVHHVWLNFKLLFTP